MIPIAQPERRTSNTFGSRASLSRSRPRRSVSGTSTFMLTFADGNLFYKGDFLVVAGLQLLVSGDEKWNQPFDIVRDGENTFSWTHSRIAAHLFSQMNARPEGCHCENTKIWPT